MLTLLNAFTARTPWRPRGFIAVFCALAASTMSFSSSAAPARMEQSRFATPEAAVTALVDAVKADDPVALGAILGARSGKLISSGDPIADAHNRETFVRAYAEANKIVLTGDRAELVVGYKSWPMPIPLAKSSGGEWYFDTNSGEAEVLARRIGANELAAIEVCRAIVDAEREFTLRDADGDGMHEYAARFKSTPGKRDGLYWPTIADEPPSPLGVLLAAAAKDGYSSKDSDLLQPYHGYYYKILTRQGKDAVGGAYSYFVKGKMMAGFALVAFPARHGASGIMSFIVNQDGIVYQKNLGKHSNALAAAMTTFNPDPSWTRVPGILGLAATPPN